MKRTDIFRLWRENITNIFLSVLALIGMEWLFIITKPSFLSLSPFQEKLAALAVSVIIVDAFLILLSIPIVLIGSVFSQNKKVGIFLITIIPAILYTCLGLLLVDNFTYTLFKVGVVNTAGVGKIAYILGVIFLFVYSSKSLFLGIEKVLTKWETKRLTKPLLILNISMIVFCCAIVFSSIINTPSFGYINVTNQEKATQPNIILITADGVNASHLNVYGYERQTTPFLSSMKKRLIISKDHFTNSGNTSGSITSMLTSKLPTTTRVLYPPDILRGTDTMEHLPAVLRSKGYYAAQFSVQHFVDAIELNFQNGFSEVNGVPVISKGLVTRLNQRIPTNSKLFLQQVEGRLLDRLGHVFFIKEMENTYTQGNCILITNY
jgi:hypothetical protein